VKLLVLHAPDVVVVVQAGKPDGVEIATKSKIAGPPTVRFAVLKPITGVDPKSLIVPVVANMGSTPEIAIGVTAPAQVDDPEKLMHVGALVTAIMLPGELEAFIMPPPLRFSAAEYPWVGARAETRTIAPTE